MLPRSLPLLCVTALSLTGCMTLSVSTKAGAIPGRDFKPQKVIEVREVLPRQIAIIGEGVWSDSPAKRRFIARLSVGAADETVAIQQACFVERSELAGGHYTIFPSCVEILEAASEQIAGRQVPDCGVERQAIRDSAGRHEPKSSGDICVDHGDTSMVVLRGFPDPESTAIAIDVSSSSERLPANRWWYALMPLAIVGDIVTLPIQAIMLVIGIIRL